MEDTTFERLVLPKLGRIVEMYGTGATEQQIAAEIGISPYAWGKLRKDNEMLRQISEGPRAQANALVQSALFRRATGYRYDEEYYEPDAAGDLHLRKVIKRTQPPDTAAAQYWLNNRDKAEWSGRQQHEVVAAPTTLAELVKLRRNEQAAVPEGAPVPRLGGPPPEPGPDTPA